MERSLRGGEVIEGTASLSTQYFVSIPRMYLARYNMKGGEAIDGMATLSSPSLAPSSKVSFYRAPVAFALVGPVAFGMMARRPHAEMLAALA